MIKLISFLYLMLGEVPRETVEKHLQEAERIDQECYPTGEFDFSAFADKQRAELAQEIALK
jgi:hypothetical protein